METSRNVITTLRYPSVINDKSFQVYLGNKGKTTRKPVIEKVNIQEGSYILQHYKKMSFISPRETGNC